MMMPVALVEEATQETSFYPPITPVSTNLPVKVMQINKQPYICTSASESRYDSSSPRSDRLIIADDCLSAASAISSSSMSKLPLKKRKISVSSVQEDDKVDKENDCLDKPIVTSKGKLKKYWCKRCNTFVALTKHDFWNHSRIHIKPEKLLTCPKCPFVTEYKHHMESHLRNHLNSKPFKCDKCNYCSVSKNMLDSHLKSHSDLRNYCCTECVYATKYYHQLKLHLNKSGHKDGLLLNDDGTVDLQNVITAHGNKRVKTMKKRAKKVKKDVKKLQELVNLVDSSPSTMLPLQQNPLILPSSTYGYDQMYHTFANNFVDDQVVAGICEEQIAPVDYSRKSASLASPSYEESEEEIDDGGPDDLYDVSEMPLDLSKPFNVYCEEKDTSTLDDNVH